MKRFTTHTLIIIVVAFLICSCASFTPVRVDVEKSRQAEGATRFLAPLLVNLKETGHGMAGVMLTDYRYSRTQKTTDRNAWVYQYDSISKKDKQYAFVILHFKDKPRLLTDMNEKGQEDRDIKYRVWLKDIAFCLVRSNKPAAITGDTVVIDYERSAANDAAMAFCLGTQTSLDAEMLLWFRNGERMKELVSLLISAFPRIQYP